MKTNVRPMCESDLDILVELEQQCFSIPWSRQALKDELSNEHAVFLVCEDENHSPLGYVGMHFVLDEGYIANVAVFAHARRQGVATSLLDALKSRADALGLAFITLEVRSQNKGAIAFYKTLGFEKMGERRHFYIMPDDDAWIMTKFLA